ncbi:DUF6461 domain-containing protein [Williamsia sp. Leaf354]|uniref:DUF6461 domain-containing protein n=1 Tax=Williamsia sp. Leaf354 TaxID=1736349 RepID=UPI000A75987B|nr:DUF6461 domain-containing protein [Williamsia sp. Leaf354]
MHPYDGPEWAAPFPDLAHHTLVVLGNATVEDVYSALGEDSTFASAGFATTGIDGFLASARAARREGGTAFAVVGIGDAVGILAADASAMLDPLCERTAAEHPLVAYRIGDRAGDTALMWSDGGGLCSEHDVAGPDDTAARATGLTSRVIGVGLTSTMLREADFRVEVLYPAPAVEHTLNGLRAPVSRRLPNPRGTSFDRRPPPDIPRRHGWTDHEPLLADHCTTIIESATVAEVVSALNVAGPPMTLDLAELIAHDSEVRAHHGASVAVAAMFEIDSCTVMFELSGGAGLLREVIVPLTVGRDVVSCARTMATSLSRVVHHRDGVVRTSVSGQYPTITHGSVPDGLRPELEALGIIPPHHDDTTERDTPTSALFDLAASLTGIDLSREMLLNRQFTVVDIALRSPTGDGFHLETIVAAGDMPPRAPLRLRCAPRPISDFLEFADPRADPDVNPYDHPGGATITVILDCTVDDVLTLISPTPVMTDIDHDRLCREVWDEDQDMIAMGIFAVNTHTGGAATILYEINGYLGCDSTFLGPLTTGREAVSVYLNGRGGDASMLWMDDEKVRAEVLSLPNQGVSGPDASALMPLLCALGDCEPYELPLSYPYGSRDEQHSRHTTGLAVVEALAGVRLDVDLFLSARFTVALLPYS